MNRSPILPIAMTLALTLVCGRSSWADEKEACASSYEQAQKLRREGKLKDARRELVVCGSDRCPSVLTPFCVQWLREIDATLPSVVIIAHGPKGNETDAVRVTIDGAVVSSRLDGRPITLDPGKHRMRYEFDGATPIDDDLFVHVGEQNRRVDLAFTAQKTGPATEQVPASPAATTSSDASSTGPSHVPAYLALGLGAVGIGIGAVTGGLAMSTKSSLDGSCTKGKSDCPSTDQSDISKLNTMSTVSTVAFIVGGVAVGGGVVLLLLQRGSKTPASTSASSVEPWFSPTGAGLRGSF